MPRKPRIPQPWQRKNRNNDWYVTIRQAQHYLAPHDATEETVRQELAKLLMDDNVEAAGDEASLVALLGRYLAHVEKNYAHETFRIRNKALRSFITSLKKRGNVELAVADLKRFHIAQWLDENPRWSNSTKRVAMSTVITALNWAKDQGYITSNPIAGIKRPPKRSRGRESCLDEETYQMWLGFCRHPHQKYILMALYRTGCRPGEVMGLGADDGTGFDEAREVWVVKGKKTRANPSGLHTVALDPLMVEMSRRLRVANPTGAIFRNTAGRKWEEANLAQMVRRFRKRSARLRPGRADYYKNLIAYGFRHTWATNRLIEGESEALVARQMGHVGTSMLHEHYNHVLTEHVKPMLAKMKRVEGESL